jgi:Sortase domain
MTAAASLLVTVGCFTIATRGYVDQSPGPPTPPASAARAVPASTGAHRLALARSTPLTLRIPAIGVSVSVSKLGLNPDGTVEVPTNFQQPGWFRLGPTPGQTGSAVILGHVDSYQGPAVFFRLGDLRKGDRVSVTLANGTVARFVVSSVAMYPKTTFPAKRVYGSHDLSALQLVTCGGVFDRRTGHYLSNIVVYTSLVAATRGSHQSHGHRDV